MNSSNLKKLAITACAALVMTAGSFTQLRAEDHKNEYLTSLTRLENFVAMTELSLKYEAPEGEEADAVAPELERLEMLAAATEASLKYVAPAVDEADAATPELERLEMLAAATEASLKYTAPEADEINDGQNNTADAHEVMMANVTK